jgi:hypothetical protein
MGGEEEGVDRPKPGCCSRMGGGYTGASEVERHHVEASGSAQIVGWEVRLDVRTGLGSVWLALVRLYTTEVTLNEKKY